MLIDVLESNTYIISFLQLCWEALENYGYFEVYLTYN